MPAHILQKSSKHYRFEPPDRRGKGALEFWAEQGFICMLDERIPEGQEKHFVVMPRREFLQRLLAINQGLGRHDYETKVAISLSGGNSNAVSAEMREALKRLISDGIDCGRIARSQGDPTNAKHAADMIKQRQRKAYSAGLKTVKLDGVVDSSVSPENDLLPPIPTKPE